MSNNKIAYQAYILLCNIMLLLLNIDILPNYA